MVKWTFNVWDKIWYLTIINDIPEKRNKKLFWECECKCGNIKWICTSHLNWWSVKSCWCLHSEMAKQLQNKVNYKYWLWKWKNIFSRIYQWIKRRCENPNDKAYCNYWWRWIKCERKTIKEFYDDMYETYKDHLEKHGEINTTIDRIDVNWNYCKWNCKRSTFKEQNNNRRDNIHITIDWTTYSISWFAKSYWLKYETAKSRIKKYLNWTMTYEKLTKKWPMQIPLSYNTTPICEKLNEHWSELPAE